MKISKVKSKPTLYFDNLNIGDLFEYEGEVYMKTEELRDIDIHINAINLEHGTFIEIYNDEILEPIYEDDYIFEVEY